jgi:hypothetical protein
VVRAFGATPEIQREDDAALAGMLDRVLPEPSG